MLESAGRQNLTRNCWHPNAWSADWQTGRDAYTTVRSVIIFEYPSAPYPPRRRPVPTAWPGLLWFTRAVPRGAYLSFDINPLIDLDSAYIGSFCAMSVSTVVG